MNIEIVDWVDAGESGLTFYLATPTKPHYPIFFNALSAFLQANHAADFIEVVPSYHSCLLAFDNTQLDKAAVKSIINAFITSYQRQQNDNNNESSSENKLHQIPICYDLQFAPDLANLAKEKNLSIDEVIQIHTGKQYIVYSIGFIPGLGFLGYVDDKIAMPRHLTPRDSVAAGGVGIAGKQTGMYPKDSPGGWQIIGKTPISLYAPEKNVFSIFKIGDTVQFYAIDMAEFNRLKAEQS